MTTTTDINAIIDETMNSIDAQEYKGYRIGDLRAIFNRMTEGMENWKLPFSIWTTGEGVLPAMAAIEFFVGETPHCSLNVETMRYLIESRGYYEVCGI